MSIERVHPGMGMDDVKATLGEPDETSALDFGGEALTTWVYYRGLDCLRVWFGEDGKVKMKRGG